MKYIYIPDSYNFSLVKEKSLTDDLFLELQIQYRMGLEKIIGGYVNLEQIDHQIEQEQIDIPQVEDTDYNFYHQYSTLKSKYIFLRNNFHVENLSNQEIKEVLDHQNNTIEFYNKTLDKVIFESGKETFFGPPMDETAVNSKSIVFEFAYDQKKCKTLDQLNKIEATINKSFDYISNTVGKNINIPLSFLIYRAIPDLYVETKQSSKTIQ